MNITDTLLHAALVACDQSYRRGQPNEYANGTQLLPLEDSGPDEPVHDKMPTSWLTEAGGISTWTVAKRFDDPNTGFGATVYSRPGVGGKQEYMVALQGTRGLNVGDWQGNFDYGWAKMSKDPTGDTTNPGNRNSADLMDYLLSRGQYATQGIKGQTGNILFTGQSLGGGLADYMAYR